VACRKQQDHTEEGKQHPPCIRLGNRRNSGIPMMLLVVATTIVLPVVALAVIMPSESQSGENQAGCDQSAYIPKVLMGNSLEVCYGISPGKFNQIFRFIWVAIIRIKMP
jgi:hypothetical protein